VNTSIPIGAYPFNRPFLLLMLGHVKLAVHPLFLGAVCQVSLGFSLCVTITDNGRLNLSHITYYGFSVGH